MGLVDGGLSGSASTLADLDFGGASAFGEQEQDAGQQADAEASKVGIDFGHPLSRILS